MINGEKFTFSSVFNLKNMMSNVCFSFEMNSEVFDYKEKVQKEVLQVSKNYFKKLFDIWHGLFSFVYLLSNRLSRLNNCQ